jgi:hypothetical protein
MILVSSTAISVKNSKSSFMRPMCVMTDELHMLLQHEPGHFFENAAPFFKRLVGQKNNVTTVE